MIARWRALSPLVQDVVSGLAFGFAWFALFEYWHAGDWHPSRPETYELAGLWAAVAIGLRRTTPRSLLAATAILYPFIYGAPLQTEFHLLPIFIAGYGAAASGRIRPSIAALGSVTPVLLITWVGYGGYAVLSGYPDRSRSLFHLFATVVVVYLGVVMRQQREDAEALAQRNTELEQLRAAEGARAVSEERTRIARELHDVVAHHLVALVVRGQAAMRLGHRRPGLTEETLGWMVGSARDALTSTRQTVRVLREGRQESPSLSPEPTLADLPWIVRRVSDAGLDVHLDIDQELPVLSDHAQLSAVRITQEALTNTLKHAEATRAVVTLRGSEHGVQLEIEDDGQGHPSWSGETGHGMLGMRERAASCGGTLEVDTGAMGGWRVRALLPASSMAGR